MGKKMATRLISLKQIRETKINRSRSWIFAEIAAGRFPKPLDLEGSGPNLWDETDVDRWLDAFIAKAKERAANGGQGGARRVRKASQARAVRADQPIA